MTSPTAPNASEPLQILRRADQALRALVPAPKTLCPGRSQAHTLESIGERLALHEKSPQISQALAISLAAILQAQQTHFPETIFWDFDFLAASLLAMDDAAQISTASNLIVSLQTQYGRHSIIRFRYVHDFVYGFDWAKWIKKDPSQRASTLPFDITFLRYLCARGKELVELINADDEKYPKLPDGGPRNPFGFSREPEQEEALHRSLAEMNLIPVPAWDLHARHSWTPPFQRRRQEEALRLQIPTRQHPAT